MSKNHEKMKRNRMTAKERKNEIIKTATTLFIEKGYKATTMKDIAKASGLSQGGFYHHYGNKADILLDVLDIGNKNRLSIMESFIQAHRDMPKEELFVELTLAKLFDENEIKKIYALYLLELSSDIQLQKKSKAMMDKATKDYIDFSKKHGFENLKFFTDPLYTNLSNCILLGIELLDLRSNFTANKALFKKLLLTVLKTESDSKGV